MELAVAEREAQAVRLEALRRRILTGATALPGVHATLPEWASHLPGTAHLWFEDVDAQALLMALDLAGIDASAGSACHAVYGSAGVEATVAGRRLARSRSAAA